MFVMLVPPGSIVEVAKLTGEMRRVEQPEALRKYVRMCRASTNCAFIASDLCQLCDDILLIAAFDLSDRSSLLKKNHIIQMAT